MDFCGTSAQDELSALGRRILSDRVTPGRLAELEQAGVGIDERLWAELASAGILSAALPAQAGGDGYGLAEQCSILIEAGRVLAPVPYLESIVLGAGVIARFGSPDQVARYAAKAAAGELVIAPALAEPGCDDLGTPGTRAEPCAGGWVLSGAKTSVQAGASAGLFLVTAATQLGTGVFCVEPGDHGLTVRPQQLLTGPGAALLSLADVELPPGRLVGSPDGEAARWLTARATVGLCAYQLGVTERALELTAEYARTRQQFGRAIGAFQAVAQRLADAFIDVDAIRLTMWQAAWRLENHLLADAEIATAKFWAAEAGHRVAHTAVHVHGGVGIDISHPVHRYFAAAKRTEFALGGATSQLRRLGAMLAG
ncbi:MAG TPA: acyl-CoA dehydrogenase family protein [Streptosporangiaceae bacterium]|nr:acyl-CoA dehydrogenase family protein [Streptosporangiaceae bacterium]